MPKVKSINQQIEAEKAKHATLENDRASIADKIAAAKAEYKTAVENGTNDKALDAMDAQLFKLDRELARASIRTAQSKDQIETLTKERVEAERQEAEEAYLQKFGEWQKSLRDYERAVEHLASAKAALLDFTGEFLRAAEKAGHETQRLRIADGRFYPGHPTDTYRTYFGKTPLAETLEAHVRGALKISSERPAETGTVTEATVN